jgi:hypothetical protein
MRNSIPDTKYLSLILIALTVLFILPADLAQASWPELDKLLASDAAAGDQFGHSVSVSGAFAIVGAQADDDNGSLSGSAYIFYYNGTSWSEQAKLLAADGAADDVFGFSASISGDYAIVGAWADDDNGNMSGSAYIFYYNGTSWSQQAKLLASDGAYGDYFGYSVSVSGDYAIVGAYADDDNGDHSGSAYIFKRSGTTWSEQAKLLASDGAVSDWFGRSVSISGACAIVGAWGDDDNGTASGSAYIFQRSGTSWSQQAKLTAADGAAGDWFGQSVSISGDYATVGAQLDDDSGSDSGSAYIFYYNGTSWIQQAKLLAADGAAGDYFGYSVSISGDYVIVGACYDDDNGASSGSAYMFKRSGTSWSQQAKLTASDGALGDGFGKSVSVSGVCAVAGAYANNDNGSDSGSAYMYRGLPEIQGSKWHDTDGDGHFLADTDEEPMPGWLIYIDENENGQFDAAEPNDITDANGNYFMRLAAVGTWLIAEQVRPCWEQTWPGGDGTYSVTLGAGEVAEGLNFGNARPTEIHPSVWEQEEQEKLVASDGAAGDSFGISVSISGACAIIGAWGDDDNGANSGSAYIFAPNDANCSDWDEVAKLTASDGAADDWFGNSVSVSGDYAIVAAYADDDNGTISGSAYIFYYDGASWNQQAKLTASDGAAEDVFGQSVSISGDYAVVGAYLDDDSGLSSGSAYIFKRSGTSWSQQAKLLAADGAFDDRFGQSVSISGDYVIVGAHSDDDNGSSSGSAYIFKRSGTNWSEQAKLTASDGAAVDLFGWSVSISGDYAIVGAHWDDDNGNESGSAYIFKRSGTNWSEQAKLTASDGTASDEFGLSVSISGDYAIAGAYYDDDNGGNSGSAYLFERSGNNWSQQAKLLASDGAVSNQLGYSVSISGACAIVGARFDDDNGASSGSAYMFGKILCPSMDGTGDGLVNFEDFTIMAGQWLQGVE